MENYLESIYSWLSIYEFDDFGDGTAYISRENIGESPNDNDATYQITFTDMSRDRYKCFIDAANIHEALGIFFRIHYDVSYDDIDDHFEV